MPSPLANCTLGDFVRRLAEPTPCPGGGSVAAYAGSLAGALVAMVGALTIGKTGFEEAASQMDLLVEQGVSLAEQLGQDVQRDTDAFQAVADAYRLPKETDAEKEARRQAIQAALRHAAEVPLEVASDCLATSELALTALRSGNPNAASDAGVAALLALAGAEGALLNVAINLASIKDVSWVAERMTALATLRERANELRCALWELLPTRVPALAPLPQESRS